MNQFAIRRYLPQDVDAVYAAADESREHVGKWMGWMTPEYSREDAAAWVEMAIVSWDRSEAYEHVIVDMNDHSIVGSCGLNMPNKKDMVCNLGYWVRASRRGQGAALQATLLLRDLGFHDLGLNRIEIVVADGNDASRKVAEKAGAYYEGLQRNRLKVGDQIFNAHMYSLIP